MTGSGHFVVRARRLLGWTATVESRRVTEGRRVWIGGPPRFWRPTERWANAAARRWIAHTERREGGPDGFTP